MEDKINNGTKRRDKIFMIFFCSMSAFIILYAIIVGVQIDVNSPLHDIQKSPYTILLTGVFSLSLALVMNYIGFMPIGDD